MHNVFISYHHANDQLYKDELIRMNTIHRIFNDMSVDIGDLDDSLPAETIRIKIRDEYLRNTTVTILLVGTQTWGRKHVDWEVYSSMFNGRLNTKSGILVINLPTIDNTYYTAAHEGEKQFIYPETTGWVSIDNRATYNERYPLMPERIIDNLLKTEAKISVVPWNRIIANPEILRYLIDATHRDRDSCEYDLSRPMRTNNAAL